MAAKKKSSKDNGKGTTKSGFIRSLPDRTPAKEVIAKAKEVGLDLTEKHVWTVQSEMRSGTKGAAKKSTKKTIKKATQTTSSAAGTAAASTTPDAPAKSAPPKSATAKGKGKKSKSKRKSKKSPKKEPLAKVVLRTAATKESTGAAQKMKSLIVQLGTDRADELYRAMRKEIDALVAR